MNGRLPTTPGSWASFIDAWAQYHKVSMREGARAALCNAFGGLSQDELHAIQAQPVAPRYLAQDDVIVHSADTTIGNPPVQVPARPVTSVVLGVPVSSMRAEVPPKASPQRITRTPPRPQPITTPAQSAPRGRIVRRAGSAK